MRVIITARQSLTPVHEAILGRLVNILGEISKNPSNPKFNQYCFESVSALIRFVCDGTPGALPQFEQAIFGPAQVILANDVTGEPLPSVRLLRQLTIRIHPLHLPDSGATARTPSRQQSPPGVSSSPSASFVRHTMGTEGKYPGIDENMEGLASPRWSRDRIERSSTGTSRYLPATRGV
jgi:hypothetical protein